MLTRAGNHGRQVEPVRRPVAGVVLFESGRASLKESNSSDAVTAGGMGKPDTDLRQALPQIAFVVRTSLPAGLQDLMRGEGPSRLHQAPGQVQGLQRGQWLFRNRLDASGPVGQGTAKRIARTLLTWATGGVAVPVAGHGRHPQEWP